MNKFFGAIAIATLNLSNSITTRFVSLLPFPMLQSQICQNITVWV
ncbi:MAG TPA: hypothetical protein V6D09_19380 [Leptolyngbyaceae cyanobacterium]